MTSVFLPEQIDRLGRQQKNEKIGFAISGLTVALLCIIALKEVKSLFKDDSRGRGR